MPISPRCCSIVTDQIIVLKESKSIFRFNNPERKKVKKIVVDGCAIVEGAKCDHLIIDSNSVEYFIELKGCDVKHALAQLEASIRQLGERMPRFAFIVSTRCPLTGNDIQIAKKRFRKCFNTELIIKNTPCEHTHS